MSMLSRLYPKTLQLCKENNIKLYLRGCKVVCTQAGKWCLVSSLFGAGYYGSFRPNGDFYPTGQCKQEFLDQLQAVEDGGMEAVARIGIATGICGICGRTLTDETSIANGIGPICAEKVGFTFTQSPILDLGLDL